MKGNNPLGRCEKKRANIRYQCDVCNVGFISLGFLSKDSFRYFPPEKNSCT